MHCCVTTTFYFSLQLLQALSGKSDVVECCFISSDVTSAPYFATPVLLGKLGVEKNLGMGKLSDYETKKLEEVCLTWHPHCSLFSIFFLGTSRAPEEYQERRGLHKVLSSTKHQACSY